MANNKAIQILRINSDGIINSKKDIELLDGQPFYNKQKNYLTVGHKTDGTVNQEPITVRKLVGYFDDKDAVGNGVSQRYSIEPDDDNDTTLKISTTTGNILIDAFQNELNSQDSNLIAAVNANTIIATGNNGKNTLEAYENNMIADNSNYIDAGASDQVGNNYIRTGYFDEDKNEFIPNRGNNYIEAGRNILNATSGNSITTSTGDNSIEAAVNFLNARIRNDITAPTNNITATGNNNVTADSGGNFIIAKNSPQNYGNQIIATDNCVGGNIIKAGAGGNIIETINNGSNTIKATGAGGSNNIEATEASGCNTIKAGTNTIEAVNNNIEAATNNIKATGDNTIEAGTSNIIEANDYNHIKATGSSGHNIIEADGNNNIKAKGNTTIIGETSVAIKTSDNEVITLQKQNSKINIKAQNTNIIGNLSIDEGNISISSDQNISFGANNTLIEASRVTSSTFNATSDRRLKENLSPYKCEKKSILDLPVYKFDYINGNKNQIGCMAQDLQEICPEIVNQGEDGYLSIQESKIVYLLLQEVKKLRKELDELRG